MEYIYQHWETSFTRQHSLTSLWGNYLMILVALFFHVFAIKKNMNLCFLVPISFGMLLVNLFPGYYVIY